MLEAIQIGGGDLIALRCQHHIYDYNHNDIVRLIVANSNVTELVPLLLLLNPEDLEEGYQYQPIQAAYWYQHHYEVMITVMNKRPEIFNQWI